MGTRNELNNICRMPICTVCVSSSTKAFWSTSMTLIEAAKQALDALHRSVERMVFAEPWSSAEIDIEVAKKAMTDLRAAIEAAEKQEPVDDELLPCPFCGGAAGIERYGDRCTSTIYECGSCGCKLETCEEFNHGAIWNTRHPAPAVPQGWQPIETAPKTGRTILLGYVNSHGNWRTLRGQWFSEEAILDWEEPDDFEAGWYETSVEADDPPNCWLTEPTHWMPLPAAPKFGEKE